MFLIFSNLTAGGDNVRKYWPRYFEGAEGVVRMTFFVCVKFLLSWQMPTQVFR